jgi:peptidoglycan/LPS O-acetylase OafA/YrhL
VGRPRGHRRRGAHLQRRFKVAILAFTILLAGLTSRLVEDPARTAPLLTRRPARRTFAAAAAATAAVLAAHPALLRRRRARSRASRVHQPQPEEDGCATPLPGDPTRPAT